MTRPSTDTSKVLTPGTVVSLASLVALTAAWAYLNIRMYDGTLGETAYAASYVSGTLLQALFAGFILAASFRIGTAERVGVAWMLIGISVAMYTFGDLVWMQLELILEVDPYPSVADVFYVLQYVFFFMAAVVAIGGYRGLLDVKRPALLSAAGAAVLFGVVYVALIRPQVLADAGAGPAPLELALGAFYPFADLFFMLAPAITLTLIIRKLGGGRLAWPWMIVIAGAVAFVLADTAHSYLDLANTGDSSLVELGWTGANLLFTIAALIARDLYLGVTRAFAPGPAAQERPSLL